MKKQALHRTLMIIAGVFTAMAILLSQSVYLQVRQADKAKTEKSAEKDGQAKKSHQHQTAIAPATSTVTVDNQAAPAVLETLTSTADKQERTFVDTRIFIDFFKVLFRAVITPNAP